MIWLLTIVVSCITVSAEICNVTLQSGKVFHPKTSIQNGADFLGHSSVTSRELCQKECCDSDRCDTILFTGSKADQRGNNCFWFSCHNHCILRNATGEESAFIVATVSKLSSIDDLPDFSDIFSTTKPDIIASKLNSTSAANETTVKVEMQPEEPSNSTTPQKEESSQPIVSTDALNRTTPQKQENPQPIASTESLNTTNKTAVNPVENATIPTQSSSDANKPVTVKDNEEKPENESKEPAEEIPNTHTPTDKAAENGEDATEKPSLPNEVPAVNHNTTSNNTEIIPEKPDVKPETKPDSEPDSSSESISENKPKGQPEVPPEPVEIDEKAKNLTTSPGSHVRVEVDIQNTVESTKPGTGYMNSKMVLWGVIIVGATMIVFGLTVVIRYYANKRRRLYSSLTDDYLINGMYSI